MSETALQSITPYQALQLVEIRVGRITRAEINARAKKPAYKLWIDFGPEIGIKTSSAQIVANYSDEDLQDRLVVCATNLGTRDIAGFSSQVLTMGMNDASGNVVLLEPAKDVPLGAKIY